MNNLLARASSLGGSSSSPTASSNLMPTRLIQLAVPANAREADVLVVETELGLFKVPLKAKAGNLRPGKQIHVDIPVPLDHDKAKKLVVKSSKLTRDGVDVEPLPEMFKLKVAIPGGAKPRDSLSIYTQVGQYDLNVPDRFDRFMEVEVPVESKDAAVLGGKPLIVVKLLLNGIDVSKPTSPPKRAPTNGAGASGRGSTRRVAFELPAGVSEGDVLDLQTEVRARLSRALHLRLHLRPCLPAAAAAPLTHHPVHGTAANPRPDSCRRSSGSTRLWSLARPAGRSRRSCRCPMDVSSPRSVSRGCARRRAPPPTTPTCRRS